jgi:hypothetical protein
LRRCATEFGPLQSNHPHTKSRQAAKSFPEERIHSRSFAQYVLRKPNNTRLSMSSSFNLESADTFKPQFSSARAFSLGCANLYSRSRVHGIDRNQLSGCHSGSFRQPARSGIGGASKCREIMSAGFRISARLGRFGGSGCGIAGFPCWNFGRFDKTSRVASGTGKSPKAHPER